MAFYYCKSGGTATGDGGRYASEKANNSWATEFTATSEYYDSVESAMNATTQQVNGDSIMVSSASTFSKGGAISLSSSAAPSSPIEVYSVDNTAVQQYLAGASETTGGSNLDYAVGTTALTVAMHGMTIEATDDITLTAQKAAFIFNDCTLRLTGSADRLSTVADGESFTLNNTTINSVAGTASNIILLNNGAYFEMNGGVSTMDSGTLNDFISGGGINGGQTAKITGVDLSNHGSGAFLFGGSGSSAVNDDIINIRFAACQLNASVGFVEEEFSSPNHYFLTTNCSSSSDAAEYQFFQRTWAGDVEDQGDSGIHRDESTAFDGGTKVSMKLTTNSSCALARPLIVDLPARFAALSSASTDTIRIYFVVSNATTLTDANTWAELMYPDGTNKQLWNQVSNRNSDILATGTTHTNDSGSSTWLDGVSSLASHNEYRMDLDTSGDVGADSVPIIRIFTTVPSVTIYIDTTVDVVA